MTTDVRPDTPSSGGGRRLALLLGAFLFIIYNANGREIGASDSQPAKYVAREIALRGTVRLDLAVAANRQFALSPAFTVDRQGHWRSSYPILPAMLAGVVAATFHQTGLVDLRAPLAPNLIATLAASALTAAAVSLVFLSLLRLTSWQLALLVAVGLGLGTNYWSVVSQTIWQHETVAFGLALALWAGLRPARDLSLRHAVVAGLGLALAGAARPQIAPLVAMLLVWISTRLRNRTALVPLSIVAAVGLWSMSLNYYWFAHVLGPMPRLEALHSTVHRVAGSWNTRPWIGAAGLLVSPSRGLFVFSPVVAIALVGIWRRRGDYQGWGLRWLLLAVVVQFVLYSCYSVWWGGHTYGPRYLLDILIPLTPFAALGAQSMARSFATRVLGTGVLMVSIAIAGLGAFVYPNELWNTRPRDVDRFHQRLWTVRDSQIARALRSRPSPRNFSLFSSDAIRRPMARWPATPAATDGQRGVMRAPPT